MIVSASHDGHGCYGLRISGENLGLWFRPEWKWVTIFLPDEDTPASMPLTESFWGSNPELRSQRIKAFLDRHGLLSWQKNNPPHFELEPLGGGAFRLKWLARKPATD